MKSLFTLSLGLFCGFLVIACGGSGGGDPIGAPELEPPVTNNSPAGLVSTSSTSLEQRDFNVSEENVGKLQNSIFSIGSNAGPAAFRQRLDLVDGRMTSLDNRQQDSARQCVTETATLFSYPEAFSLPGDLEFPLYLQCFEQLSDDLQMAFGIRDNVFYLIEIQQQEGDAGIIVLAKANTDGSLVEAWQLSVSDSGAAGVLHVLATDSDNSIVMNYAAEDANNGTTCGIFLRSNSSLVYLNADFQDYDGDASNCGGLSASCIAASDLSTQTESECSDAGLNAVPSTFGTSAFTGSSLDTDDIATGITALLGTTITGLTDFDTEATTN